MNGPDGFVEGTVFRAEQESAWTWHTTPRAVEYEGATYWGAVVRTAEDRSGIVVSAYDHATGRVTASPVVLEVGRADDHCNPSVWVRPDGRIVLGAAGHTSDRLWYAISAEPGDVSQWRVSEVRPGRYARYSYTQMAFLADDGPQGRVYWFFRGRGSDNVVRHKLLRLRGYANWWAFATSVDWGETWSDATMLWRERGVNVPYTHVTSNCRDTLYFSRSDTVDRIDPSNRRNVMACQLKGGVLRRMDGARICSVEQLPLTRHRALDLVYDSTAQGNHAAFNLDLTVGGSGSPVIGFSTLERNGSPETYTNHFHIGRWNGSTWTVESITSGGPSIYRDDSHPHYSGALSIDRTDPDTVYLGVVRPEEAVEGAIEVWRRDASAGTWARAGFVAPRGRGGGKAFRPACPEGSTGRVRVLWLTGRYDSYTDWSCHVEGLAETD